MGQNLRRFRAFPKIASIATVLALASSAQAQPMAPAPAPAPTAHAPAPAPAAAPGADEPPPAAPAPTANTQDADREARTLFEQGRVAFDEGRYRDAWDYFHRAYQLSKRPKLLYNVGQSADRLRMDREALKAFKLYLKKVPDADNRKEVEARVKALEERFAREGDPVPGAGEPAGLQAEADGEPVSFLEDEDDFDDPGATPAAPPEDETEEDVPAAPPGNQPMRSGWYLRLALGAGYLSDKLNGNMDPTLTSALLSGHAGVGYGVTAGVVVGGMLFLDAALAPKADGSEVDSATLTMLGAFADWYLYPTENGWHVFGALALAGLAKTDMNGNVGSKSATGFGVTVGGGYEWPMGRTFGLGALGRITFAPVSDTLAGHNVAVISAMASATWY
jgi:hypothetical protein